MNEVLENFTEEQAAELSRKAQYEYNKKWRAENKDRIRRYNRNYWLKKALAKQAQEEQGKQ